MDLGVRLPTGTTSAHLSAHELADRAARCEALGFGSVWCMDHLLRADYGLGAATLDPLTVLPVLLAATGRAEVGTALLIAPLREPLRLLKQLGSLSVLGGDRLLLGLGAGWDEAEFTAAGVARSERRRRLDDVVSALVEARETGRLSWGAHAVDPAPVRLGGIFVGGGTSTVSREAAVTQGLAPSVRDRIARVDGWIARSTTGPEQVAADLAQVTAVRPPGRALRVLRTTFLHVSTRADPDAAIDEQLTAYRAAGWTGTRAQFIGNEPAGSVDAVARRFASFAEHDVSTMIVHPIGDVDKQLGLIASQLLPRLAPDGPRP